jgi:hypothetical protein
MWFDEIWHTGDPSRWGPFVFTEGSVMIDSVGTSTGPGPAASDFLLLFKYFPQLRGEVISWAHNDTEILINWRFVVSNGKTVPVIDKFCFVKGLVSFRLAYFDTMTLISYLAENYGSAQVTDYVIDKFVKSARGIEIFFVPALLWAIAKGLFLWSEIPPDAPLGLTATPGERQVTLKWEAVPGAKSYKVKRSEVSGGPYGWIDPEVIGTSYVDTKTIESGKKYYYVVCTNTQDTTYVPPVRLARRVPA